MDYTVGSIADLISGKKTPNKPKVQKLTLEQPTYETSAISDKEAQQKPKKNGASLKPNTKGKKQKLSPSDGDSNMVVINHEMLSGISDSTQITDDNVSHDRKLKKKFKKRKSEEVDEQVEPHQFKRKKQSGDVSENTSEKVRKIKKKKNRQDDKNDNKQQNPETKEDVHVKAERDARTIFVGNVPVTVKKRSLLRLFTKYGHVESVRLRCIAPAEPGIPKRVAFIKKLMHPKRLTMHSYVTFSVREDALKALAANGVKYKDHHIRVQISNDTEKPDPNKAIFVGNLPFDVEDEDLWSTFDSCGPIVSVRIVRDASTNMGIGIAYVNFESSDAVELALQMDNVTVKKNVIRIHRYSQKKKHGQRHRKNEHKNRMGPPHKKSYKRPKNYPGTEKTSDEKKNTLSIAVKNNIFQGSKSNIKKKKPKLNKGVVSKMKLTQKIAPR